MICLIKRLMLQAPAITNTRSLFPSITMQIDWTHACVKENPGIIPCPSLILYLNQQVTNGWNLWCMGNPAVCRNFSKIKIQRDGCYSKEFLNRIGNLFAEFILFWFLFNRKPIDSLIIGMKYGAEITFQITER